MDCGWKTFKPGGGDEANADRRSSDADEDPTVDRKSKADAVDSMPGSGGQCRSLVPCSQRLRSFSSGGKKVVADVGGWAGHITLSQT